MNPSCEEPSPLAGSRCDGDDGWIFGDWGSLWQAEACCFELDPPEFEFSGCLAVGTGGRHSEAYGDDGEWICDWCGARPRHPVSRCQGDSFATGLFPYVQPHPRHCHCADCVPCVHHPGEDCGCWCRFGSCSPESCPGVEESAS